MKQLDDAQKAIESARFLTERASLQPVAAFLTGTGLGDSFGSLKPAAEFDYRDIPHFPVSTVQSHYGKLLFGTVSDAPVAVMQGRFHMYEGYSSKEVTFPVRVMQELAVKVLVISNASGGLNPRYRAGDIMIISDHINLTGENPLIGPNADRWGLRFPDMGRAYDPDLARTAESVCRKRGVSFQKGVYAGLKGPSLETPAEVRFLRTVGADAVGFSTVPEVIAGVHGGMRILGLSVVTNVHDPDDPAPAAVEDIIAAAADAAPKLDLIFTAVLESLDHA